MVPSHVFLGEMGENGCLPINEPTRYAIVSLDQIIKYQYQIVAEQDPATSFPLGKIMEDSYVKQPTKTPGYQPARNVLLLDRAVTNMKH